MDVSSMPTQLISYRPYHPWKLLCSGYVKQSISQRQQLNLWSNVSSCVCVFVDPFGVSQNNALLPLYVSTTKFIVEFCISEIGKISQVQVTIWLSIIVVFSSKWSNKGHMLSAQVSAFKHGKQLADRSPSHLHKGGVRRSTFYDLESVPAIELIIEVLPRCNPEVQQRHHNIIELSYKSQKHPTCINMKKGGGCGDCRVISVDKQVWIPGNTLLS